MMMDTIFALSSGAGTAGVAVIRLSGPKALEALMILSGKDLPKPRMAALRELKDHRTGVRLDKSLVLTFPAPASFTGEDVVELHLHGGRSVITGVLEALTEIDSLRMAEPGEFSKRAFENEKLDLTEAEGLNDLIHAQTAAQREQALRQLDGALKDLYEDWRGRLIGHLAHLEADIDFPDEDLPEGVAGAVLPNITSLRDDIEGYLKDNKRAEAIRDGFRIVILGEPNAGKSTLMNALSKSDVAIVSDEKGTTRDVIEVNLDLGGYPVRLIDTAGLREGEGDVEREGIRRAEKKAEEADLRLVLVRADEWPTIPEAASKWLDEDAILVITQTDRVSMFHVKHDDVPNGMKVITASVRDNHGLDELLSTVEDFVSEAMAPRELPSLTRVRHRKALEDTVDHLYRFEDNAGLDAVLAAEDVRMAARSLGKITGRVGVEDMLDVVFSDFCIGK
ncbi:tRNA uridine-5-carboxymethylaminomethyl(34) synthesis GTPase MnmE [Kordiimonas sp. SCSIO 12603]|uniref:tRNA uridine-5-carboxymethylaminomethyl(34) synthesis GTPase MnmE n=1 Tax=Kordiimonas sp. SCSIO 12603 TaxID=2829596 RepID=UPI00210277F1|nr:tRNA uridine-5-carboxymethylaminomethyl(34) synthesis GTPase MnmE [Kordiimonas sp. SCSIO 12603]UTW59106.1 tRNA uridine-5-carboxymethylaminomethyl(34) synthesis GTPase MnmE [Kordiimonas sp. SCSIO 12603]